MRPVVINKVNPLKQSKSPEIKEIVTTLRVEIVRKIGDDRSWIFLCSSNLVNIYKLLTLIKYIEDRIAIMEIGIFLKKNWKKTRFPICNFSWIELMKMILIQENNKTIKVKKQWFAYFNVISMLQTLHENEKDRCSGWFHDYLYTRHLSHYWLHVLGHTAPTVYISWIESLLNIIHPIVSSVVPLFISIASIYQYIFFD